MTLIDWIGTLGTFQILLAYVLQLMNKIKKTDLIFILLNTVGAGMACAASILLDYIPFIILEAVWTLASLVSLGKYIKTKNLKNT